VVLVTSMARRVWFVRVQLHVMGFLNQGASAVCVVGWVVAVHCLCASVLGVVSTSAVHAITM
jgi:hypothetical protein